MVDGEQDRYDVAVLGCHLAGGLLAAVLAKHGDSVVLVDGPRDRVDPSGETTVPYTTAVFQLLATRFGIPEIAAFAHFPDLPPEVRERSGLKKSLTFLHHTAGEVHDPSHTVQFNVPGEHNEWHLHRPVVDEHACDIAARYGAHRLVGRPVVTGVDLRDDGATVTVVDGRRLDVRFVVDACGTESPLADRFGLVEGTCALRSRSLTTTMRGVEPFEGCVPFREYGDMTPWSLGTVHHLFDGGWIQVVDFGNHPESSNGECGVTVGVDPDLGLPCDSDAAFAALAKRFPSIQGQFRLAEPTRQWAGGDPWQLVATRTNGPRWFAMERSACRTDELLSRDVTMAAEVVHALAPALWRGLADEASLERRLRKVAEFQRELVAFNDRMLASARIACGDFALWNAYSRVWLLWQIVAHLSLVRATADAQTDPSGSWTQVERFGLGAIWFDVPDGLRQLLDWFFARLDAVGRHELPARTAADDVFRRLRKDRFVPPLYRFGDPAARVYRFTAARRLLMLAWTKTVAPHDFRRLLRRNNVTGQRESPPDAEEPREREWTSA